MPKNKLKEVLLILFVLIITNSFVLGDDTARFINDFQPTRHVYDYANILGNAFDNELSNYKDKLIYVVTLNSGSNADIIKNQFKFENTEKYIPASPISGKNQQELTSGETNNEETFPKDDEETNPPINGNEETPLQNGEEGNPSENGNEESSPQNGEEINLPSRDPQIPSNNVQIPSGYGSILTYKDVGDWPDGTKNGFKLTGVGMCWPQRDSDEPDWKKIWKEHACMQLPESFELIQVPFSWVNEPGEGYYDVSIRTNAYVGKLYKEGTMWMYKDRDNNVYTVAPIDSNDPDYNWLNNQYHDPEYSVSSLQESTKTMILYEKYGAMKRLYGGSKGYPIPQCTGQREHAEKPINVDEGSSTQITGYATLNNVCSVIIAYIVNGEFIIGSKNCNFDTKKLIEDAKVSGNLGTKDAKPAIERVIKILTKKQLNCEESYNLGNSELEQGNTQKAESHFLDAYNKCKNDLKFKAGYQILNLKYNGMKYKEAVSFGENLFEETKGKNPDLAKKSLKIVILSLNNENLCDGILEAGQWWEENGYSEDSEISKIIQFCKESITPAKKIVKNNHDAISTFQNEMSSYKTPTGTEEEVIKGKIDIAWDLYNKGRYVDSSLLCNDILTTYFEKDLNKDKYRDMFQSVSKLYILDGFNNRKKEENRIFECNFWGKSMYIEDYFSTFGIMDDDIERAWDECSGEVYKKITGDKCKTMWPTSEGKKIDLREIIDSCSLFEAIHPSMQRVVNDASKCCSGNSDISEPCLYAKQYSHLSDLTQNKKRCVGIYIIRAVATGKYIQNYFKPKNNCNDKGNSNNLYAGKCDSENRNLFNSNALSMPCLDNLDVVWGSDTDMSKNNCNTVVLPAHATLDIIKTGICGDYSILVTSLLRAAGYKSDEVYSVDQSIHVTNLVRLPGDVKYHHVDTTGGHKEGIVFDGVLYTSKDWNKVGRYHCYNDMGDFKCPENSMIYERFIS